MISKKFMLVSGLIFFVLIVALSGCTSKEAVTATSNNTQLTTETPTTGETKETSATEKANKVTTISIFLAQAKNWDADAEIDGIELTLQPRDSKDDIVAIDGVLSARLYESDYSPNFEPVKGKLIQEWNNIPINESDFSWNGVKVHLEYPKDFKPGENDKGWLELTFKTKDGKKFETVEKTVFIGYSFS